MWSILWWIVRKTQEGHHGSPDSRCTELYRTIQGPVDDSKTKVVSTLTQLKNGRDWVIVFFSKKLFDTEMSYIANDCELLVLVKIWPRLRIYCKFSELEIFVDNQVLQYSSFTGPVGRREAWWLKTLGNFEIFEINIKSDRVMCLVIRYQESLESWKWWWKWCPGSVHTVWGCHWYLRWGLVVGAIEETWLTTWKMDGKPKEYWQWFVWVASAWCKMPSYGCLHGLFLQFLGFWMTKDLEGLKFF